MTEHGRVTLREIAEKAGVTRMTVSLALRGRSRISEATRARVLKAAKSLGYEPDPEVAKLMAHIRRKQPAHARATLAMVTSGPSADAWNRTVTEREYVEGARARAREYGYRIENFWLHEPGMTGHRLSDIIWHRGIEGVIIAPLQGKLSSKKPRSVDLNFELFPAVEIGETVSEPDLDRAIHDQYTSMLKALHELEARGYDSMGLILEDALDLRVNHKWSAAYVYHRQRGRSRRLAPPLVIPTAKQALFDRWYTRYRPKVILSVARFALPLIEAYGLAIPGDVAYASLDISGTRPVLPDVSGIDQNSTHVAAAAVDMLVSAVQRGQRGIPEHPYRTEIEGTWVPGKTAPRQREVL